MQNGSNPRDVHLSDTGAALGPHAVEFESLKQSIRGMTVLASSMVQELEDHDDGSGPNDLTRILRCVDALALTTREVILLLKPERTAANGPAQTIPPVLPLDIGKLLPVEFGRISSAHKERYENFMGPGTIDDVCKDYRSLRGCVSLDREPMLNKSLLQAAASRNGFMAAWKPVGSRFEHLRLFAGGIATLFQGSSSVESDLSIIKYETDDYRSRMENLSVEGTLHAKQREPLIHLRSYVLDI
jgi:hypothetical protein